MRGKLYSETHHVCDELAEYPSAAKSMKSGISRRLFTLTINAHNRNPFWQRVQWRNYQLNKVDCLMGNKSHTANCLVIALSNFSRSSARWGTSYGYTST